METSSPADEESKSSQLRTSDHDHLTLDEDEEHSVSQKSYKKKGRPFDSLTNIQSRTNETIRSLQEQIKACPIKTEKNKLKNKLAAYKSRLAKRERRERQRDQLDN